jgi:cobalt/nickel transport system permease protein
VAGQPAGSAVTSSLQALDSRTQFLSALLFILSVNLIPEGSWALFGVFLTLLMLCIGLSKVRFGAVLRRSLLATPFVLTLFAVPFVTPGPPLWTVPCFGWALSEPGLVRFGTLLVRFILSVQAAVFLVLVSSPPSLFIAMRKLGMPSILLAVISLTYRYLSVITEEARSMMTARKARSVAFSGKPSLLWQARVAGNMVGSLFLRTIDRSDRIFAAMLSRGFDGTVRSLEVAELGRLDWMIIGSWALITLSVAVRRMT